MGECFRVLDLKSGGPWFSSSTLLLSGSVFGSPGRVHAFRSFWDLEISKS